jgi:hypothetical protein
LRGFGVRGLLQQLLPEGIFRILQHTVGIVRKTGLMETNQIAHEPNEDQIRRASKCFAQRENLATVLRVKVAETVRASACEEHFTCAGRILPFEG